MANHIRTIWRSVTLLLVCGFLGALSATPAWAWGAGGGGAPPKTSDSESDSYEKARKRLHEMDKQQWDKDAENYRKKKIEEMKKEEYKRRILESLQKGGEEAKHGANAEQPDKHGAPTLPNGWGPFGMSLR